MGVSAVAATDVEKLVAEKGHDLCRAIRPEPLSRFVSNEVLAMCDDLSMSAAKAVG